MQLSYLIWLWKYLPFRMMEPTGLDIVFCSLMLFITLDFLRRKTGWPLVLITALFILYIVYGISVPIDISRTSTVFLGMQFLHLPQAPVVSGKTIWCYS